MTATQRDYRFRIATQGAVDVDGYEEITLGLSDLHEIPVVTTQIADVLAGSTQSRPWVVHAIDRDGQLTYTLTGDARWRAIGRLCDVQYRDLPSGDWVSYGTGRISSLTEDGGPGLYRIEVSDEAWKARRVRIFDVADSTQIFPGGWKRAWRGLEQHGGVPFNGGGHAFPAMGTRGSSFLGGIIGDVYRIDMKIDPRIRKLPPVNDAMIEWIKDDARGSLSEDGTTERIFRHLRCNYDGTDYEVRGFHRTAPVNNNFFETLEQPITGTGGTQTIRCWIYSETTPPASGDAFLHAPTAPPSRLLPLHLGADGEWR